MQTLTPEPRGEAAVVQCHRWQLPLWCSTHASVLQFLHTTGDGPLKWYSYGGRAVSVSVSLSLSLSRARSLSLSSLALSLLSLTIAGELVEVPVASEEIARRAVQVEYLGWKR